MDDREWAGTDREMNINKTIDISTGYGMTSVTFFVMIDEMTRNELMDILVYG